MKSQVSRASRYLWAVSVLGAGVLVASLFITPVSAEAVSDTGSGGVFVPATGRILNTSDGTGGFTTPMPAAMWRTLTVAGQAGIPSNGSVGAISLIATVSNIAAEGQLLGRPSSEKPSSMLGKYGGVDHDDTSFSVVLAVSDEGKIELQTQTSAQLTLDVQGYYTASPDGTAPGGFVPLNGARIADTRSGVNLPAGALAPGGSVAVQVTGKADIPSGASAAIVNFTIVNTTALEGSLTAYRSGAPRPAGSLAYAASTNTTLQAQVQLSPGGKFTIFNTGTTAHVVVDVQGYFTATDGGALFTPGAGGA